MEAILDVPEAVLVLLGYGVWQQKLIAQVTEAPWAGRVHVLPAVPPSELLPWTASADVSVMAIQPSSLNHRYTTPQKLFESIAAGVPVVASDLPGMAEIVRTDGIGVLCDPTSPGEIAAGIRTIVSASAAERWERRARILRVAHERYNWESQLDTLLALYGELAPVGGGSLAVGAEVARPGVG
jgi:glycosyltransferase involved in cell wall biosynthesis